MDNPMKNTTYDFELDDGSAVKLTLNFYFLYQLRSTNKELYERYNAIMQRTNKDNFDILDMATICYVGYMCANLQEENLLSEEDFYMLCGNNMKAVAKAVNHLMNAKKR